MIDQWNGCYDQGWGKNLVPEAFSHPAKVSFSLAGKIYDHAINMRWVKKGDLILDPFAGICGFGFHALFYGLNFIGVELEEKFVKLGQQNIEKWERDLRCWTNLGTARIVQGDSRRLGDVIKKADLVLSSPPYADWHGDDKRFGILRHKDGCKCNFCKKNKGNMGFNQGYQDVIEKADIVISSPPFTETHGRQAKLRGQWCAGGGERFLHTQDYAKTPGNLANLKEGKFDMVCSSPQYLTETKGQGLNTKKPKSFRGVLKDGTLSVGQSPGQLGAMKEGSIDAVISSPPFMTNTGGKGEASQNAIDPALFKRHLGSIRGGINSLGNLGSMKEGGFDAVVRPIDLICSSPPYEGITATAGDPKYAWKFHGDQSKYGDSKNNLGNSSGDTFWAASKIIVEQCYDLLKDGGHAIWVCKDYVKKGQRVPFSDRWLSLCESVGFRLVCRHQAMLVKDYGTQITINGEENIQTERKSFFRRLAESKGSPRIDEEDVLCLVKEQEK